MKFTIQNLRKVKELKQNENVEFIYETGEHVPVIVFKEFFNKSLCVKSKNGGDLYDLNPFDKNILGFRSNRVGLVFDTFKNKMTLKEDFDSKVAYMMSHIEKYANEYASKLKNQLGFEDQYLDKERDKLINHIISIAKDSDPTSDKAAKYTPWVIKMIIQALRNHKGFSDKIFRRYLTTFDDIIQYKEFTGKKDINSYKNIDELQETVDVAESIVNKVKKDRWLNNESKSGYRKIGENGKYSVFEISNVGSCIKHITRDLLWCVKNEVDAAHYLWKQNPIRSDSITIDELEKAVYDKKIWLIKEGNDPKWLLAEWTFEFANNRNSPADLLHEDILMLRPIFKNIKTEKKHEFQQMKERNMWHVINWLAIMPELWNWVDNKEWYINMFQQKYGHELLPEELEDIARRERENRMKISNKREFVNMVNTKEITDEETIQERFENIRWDESLFSKLDVSLMKKYAKYIDFDEYIDEFFGDAGNQYIVHWIDNNNDSVLHYLKERTSNVFVEYIAKQIVNFVVSRRMYWPLERTYIEQTEKIAIAVYQNLLKELDKSMHFPLLSIWYTMQNGKADGVYAFNNDLYNVEDFEMAWSSIDDFSDYWDVSELDYSKMIVDTFNKLYFEIEEDDVISYDFIKINMAPIIAEHDLASEDLSMLIIQKLSDDKLQEKAIDLAMALSENGVKIDGFKEIINKHPDLLDDMDWEIARKIFAPKKGEVGFQEKLPLEEDWESKMKKVFDPAIVKLANKMAEKGQHVEPEKREEYAREILEHYRNVLIYGDPTFPKGKYMHWIYAQLANRSLENSGYMRYYYAYAIKEQIQRFIRNSRLEEFEESKNINDYNFKELKDINKEYDGIVSFKEMQKNYKPNAVYKDWKFYVLSNLQQVTDLCAGSTWCVKDEESAWSYLYPDHERITEPSDEEWQSYVESQADGVWEDLKYDIDNSSYWDDFLEYLKENDLIDEQEDEDDEISDGDKARYIRLYAKDFASEHASNNADWNEFVSEWAKEDHGDEPYEGNDLLLFTNRNRRKYLIGINDNSTEFNDADNYGIDLSDEDYIRDLKIMQKLITNSDYHIGVEFTIKESEDSIAAWLLDMKVWHKDPMTAIRKIKEVLKNYPMTLPLVEDFVKINKDNVQDWKEYYSGYFEKLKSGSFFQNVDKNYKNEDDVLKRIKKTNDTMLMHYKHFTQQILNIEEIPRWKSMEDELLRTKDYENLLNYVYILKQRIPEIEQALKESPEHMKKYIEFMKREFLLDRQQNLPLEDEEKTINVQ